MSYNFLLRGQKLHLVELLSAASKSKMQCTTAKVLQTLGKCNYILHINHILYINHFHYPLIGESLSNGVMDTEILPSLSSVGLEWRLRDLKCNSAATDERRSFSWTLEESKQYCIRVAKPYNSICGKL